MLKFTYAPDSPLQQFSFTLPANLAFNMSEKLQQENTDRAEMIIRTHSLKRLAQNSVTIDFGITAKRADDAPPPVAGVDFWQRDRTHIQAPVTQNMMPNPSFEQGLRYWRWWFGGGSYEPSDIPAYSISSDAVFGDQALCIKPTQGRQPLQSFSIPVLKNKSIIFIYRGVFFTASF